MKRLVPLITVLTLLGSSLPSYGATVTRASISHGPANCQAALPVFDGLIRKRPKAIANEGTTVAFVTCDFESTPDELNVVPEVVIYFRNRGENEAPVSCTLVQGLGDIVFAPAVTKTLNVATNATQTALSWTASDNGEANMTMPSVSCSLSPGIEIYGTRLKFIEEIGT